MIRPVRWLSSYATSLAGRISLLLTIGIAGSSVAALFVAEHVRIRAIELSQLERVVASTADMADRFSRAPVETQSLLNRRELFGVRNAMHEAQFGAVDDRLPAMLSERLGPPSQVVARLVTSDCFGEMFDPRNRVAGQLLVPPVDCWQIAFNDRTGRRREIIVDLPSLRIPHNATLDPTYLILILIASGVLATLAARLTTVPLRHLIHAAKRFSLSTDPEPVPETGPSEVRAALHTFNLMQTRVREGFRERTQILAAIAHDLQTPLTRLRLRLEQVEDGPLRDKLVNDLVVMQGLVRDGLELARSSELREPWSVVHIGSLVESLVEDHAEIGAPVTLVASCDISSRVKPDALTRCVENLVSNAVKYGGSAELACRVARGMIEISIVDRGPGIPRERLSEVFEPFVRSDSSRSRATGGTGIGLSIALAQAKTFGGHIELANLAEGGLRASLTFPVNETMPVPAWK
jgi:signal transduction histidine kinase